MKKIVRLLFCGVALAALASPATALARLKTRPRKPFFPQYDKITAVDRNAQTITVGHANSKDTKTTTYKITDRTEIDVNDQKGTINDLKVGMKIDVTQGMDPTIAERLVQSTPPANPPVPKHKHH